MSKAANAKNLDQPAAYKPGKLLFVLNEPSALNSALGFLTKSGYKLKVANNIAEAMTLTQSFDPDLILLSWNLKDANIKKVYLLLTHQFKKTCLVFNEDKSTAAAASLGSAGIADILFAPVSGQGVHQKAQEILGREPRKLALAAVSAFRKPLTISQLPKSLKWEQVASPENEVIWRASTKDENGKEQVFFFKGQKSPAFNAAVNAWENIDDETALYTEDIATDDNGPLLMQERAASRGPQVPTYEERGKISVIKSSKPPSLLAKGVSAAMESHCEPPSAKPDKKISVVAKVSVAFIQGAGLTGYLLGAKGDGPPSREFAEKITDQLKGIMKDSGVPLLPDLHITEVDFDPMNFMSWTDEKAEFIVMSQIDGEQVAFAFFATNSIPEFGEIPHGPEVIAVNLQKYFVGDKVIPFDVFLHMPKNNKFILYLKAGTVFKAHNVEKLIGFGIKNVYIRIAQQDLFFGYCAKATIARAK